MAADREFTERPLTDDERHDAALEEAFYLDIKAGADVEGLRRTGLRPSTLSALDAAIARVEAEILASKREAKPVPPLDQERWGRVVAAVRTIHELNNLGDGVYDVRSRRGGDPVNGKTFTGDSWQHPTVQRYGDAVSLLQAEGVI